MYIFYYIFFHFRIFVESCNAPDPDADDPPTTTHNSHPIKKYIGKKNWKENLRKYPFKEKKKAMNCTC